MAWSLIMPNGQPEEKLHITFSATILSHFYISLRTLFLLLTITRTKLGYCSIKAAWFHKKRWTTSFQALALYTPSDEKVRVLPHQTYSPVPNQLTIQASCNAIWKCPLLSEFRTELLVQAVTTTRLVCEGWNRNHRTRRKPFNGSIPCGVFD